MSDWLPGLFRVPAIRRQVLRRWLLWSLAITGFLGLNFYFSWQESRSVALELARERSRTAAARWVKTFAPMDGPALSPHPAPGSADPGNPQEGRVVRPRLHGGAAAAGWEERALARLAAGASEHWELQADGQAMRLRYMAPLRAAEACLNCHGRLGSRAGDLLGGLGLAVPLSRGAFLNMNRHDWVIASGAMLLWFAGMLAILFAGRTNLARDRERRQAEADLRDSEQLYRELLEHQGEGFAIADSQERFVLVNPVADALFGLPRGGLLGRSLMDFLDDDQRRLVRGQTALRTEGKSSTYELPIRRADGQSSTLLLTATPRTGPEGTQSIGVFRDITERKRVEEAYRWEKERAQRYLDVAEVILVALDREARITMLNRKGHAVLGWEPGTLEGENWFRTCLPAEDHDRLSGVFQQVVAGRMDLVDTYENEVVRRDGERRLIAWNNSVLTDAEGRILGTLSSGEDITARRQAERDLQRSEERLRSYIEQSIDVIFTLDGSGTFQFISPAWERHFGIAVDAAGGRGFAAFVHPDDVPACLEHLQRVMASGVDETSPPFRVKHANGSWRWFQANGVRMRTAEGGTSYMGVAHDITERRQAEISLGDSQARLLRAERVSRLGNWELDLVAGRFRASQGGQAIYGLPGGEWSIPEVQRVALPEHRPVLDRALRDLVAEGRPYNVDFQIRRVSDGQIRDIHSVAEFDPVRRTVFGVLRDVTDERRTERERAALQLQLQHAQKMESLGTLAGGIAHDMNNILGAILGLADANRDRHPAGSPARGAFDTIVRAAERGGEMVKRLLGFTRRQQAATRTLDFNALMLEGVRLLERTTLSRIRIIPDLADDLHPVEGDDGALSHVIINLCINAVDAMPETGTLTFRTRNDGADWVVAEIEDTGTGMPVEVLERAMDPFFTTKDQGKGTGLGLALAYSTMQAHRGGIELSSQPGQGTRVTLRLPAKTSPTVNPSMAVQAEGTPPTGAWKVLVIDDDELLRCSLEVLLHSLGHSPVLTASGEEALERLEGGFLPDAVLLDMNMPGLGGRGTLPLLRKAHPHLPVLLVTGRADQTALDLVAADAHALLLAKPFARQELKEALDRCMADGRVELRPRL